MALFELLQPEHWFHVKYEWKKNPTFSTLCVTYCSKVGTVFSNSLIIIQSSTVRITQSFISLVNFNKFCLSFWICAFVWMPFFHFSFVSFTNFLISGSSMNSWKKLREKIQTLTHQIFWKRPNFPVLQARLT